MILNKKDFIDFLGAQVAENGEQRPLVDDLTIEVHGENLHEVSRVHIIVSSRDLKFSIEKNTAIKSICFDHHRKGAYVNVTNFYNNETTNTLEDFLLSIS